MNSIKHIIEEYIDIDPKFRYFELPKIFGFDVYKILEILETNYSLSYRNDKTYIEIFDNINRNIRTENSDGVISYIKRNSKGELINKVSLNKNNRILCEENYVYDRFGRIKNINNTDGYTLQVQYEYGDYLYYFTNLKRPSLYDANLKEKWEKTMNDIIYSQNEGI